MSRRERGWPPVPEALPVAVVDNHTHFPVGADDDPGVREGSDPLTMAEQLERAAAVGVDRMVQVGCDLDTLAPSVALAEEHPEIVAALAIHPNEAPLHAGVLEVAPDGLDPALAPRHETSLADAVARVAELARHERVRAIGETGLDYFRGGERAREVQRAAFREHVAIAKELGLALQIHDRDAHEDVVALLLADGAPERTVFHCFSGDVGLARACAEHGWYVSVAGPVTFKANDDLRAAVREVPRELLLVETDAPYLTPAPHRGRPNAPYLLPLTVRRLAEETGVPLADLCHSLTANTEAVYGTW
ncbi:TatD family deoxyribonuclease [Georgenia wutianyii]|uniref:TatD family deoxyribonuclease n=1 Tax=Georgenia wutianyii TaxID=2585135 RepID=A0ABX5VIW1_9MICO|nr:TatD family hydrolase [Georgenia wutianyii]QDB78307.1 TatD family deoxyribonuclease [Georgenia wutianyii]